MPSDTFSTRPALAASSHSPSAVLGQGSFGVVRVAWAFATAQPDADGAPLSVLMTSADGSTSSLVSTPSPPRRPCAYTVAVKTVRVPRDPYALTEYLAAAACLAHAPAPPPRSGSEARTHSTAAPPVVGATRHRGQQQSVWNELVLLERIHRQPHPNIVQCWGFHLRHAMPSAQRRHPASPPTTTRVKAADGDAHAHAVEDNPGSADVGYHVPRASAQPLDGLAQAALRLVGTVVRDAQQNMRLDLMQLFQTHHSHEDDKDADGSEREAALNATTEASSVMSCACTAAGVTTAPSSAQLDELVVGSAVSSVPVPVPAALCPGLPEGGLVPFNFVLDSAREADVVMSLCSGGTLKAYVAQQADIRRTELFAALVPNTPTVPGRTSGEVQAGPVPEPKTRSLPWSSASTTQPGVTHSPSSPAAAAAMPSTSTSAVSAFANTRWTLAVSERCLVAILVAVLHALHHVHTELRVLHRDVKPANVLLCVGASAEISRSDSDPCAAEATPAMWWSTTRPCAVTDQSVPASTHEPFPILVAPAVRAPLRLATVEIRQHKSKASKEAKEVKTVKTVKHAQTDSPSSPSASMPVTDEGTPQASKEVWSRHKVEVHVLAQPEAWRVQLADFGVSTAPGQLRAAQGGVGTRAFMAPEVSLCGVPRGLIPPSSPVPAAPPADSASPMPNTKFALDTLMTPLFADYGVAADVYSLGVTFQYLVVRGMAGVPSLTSAQIADLVQRVQASAVQEEDEATERARRTVLMRVMAQWDTSAEGIAWHHHMHALPTHAMGARWVDETEAVVVVHDEGPGPRMGRSAPPPAPPTFVVPRDWRCDQEVVAGSVIRARQTSPPPPPPHVPQDGESAAEGRPSFVVPSAWRCREELLHRQHVRPLALPRSQGTQSPTTHHHRATPSTEEDILFEGSTPGATEYKHQQRRCRSCGKLHRHLVELLNAMTAADPAARPTVLDCLRSTAVLEQGQMEAVPAALDGHRQRAADTRARDRAAKRRPSPLRGLEKTTTEGPIDDSADPDVAWASSEPGTPLERTYLWRPPSLHFLKSKEDVPY